MAPEQKVDRRQARNQAQRARKRRRRESLQREYRVRSRMSGRRAGDRIGHARKQRDHGLENAERFVHAHRPRRGLGVGVRRESREAG